jgi:hypothetical protein
MPGQEAELPPNSTDPSTLEQPADGSDPVAGGAGMAPPAVAAPSGPRDLPPGPTDTFDAYRRAIDAMRDATKWVMAFVPGATVIFALIGLLPKLADLSSSAPQRTSSLWWIVGGILASSVSLVAASFVLTAGPVGWGKFQKTLRDDLERAGTGGPKGRTLYAELGREGVLSLYGYSSVREFQADLNSRSAAVRPIAVATGSTALDFATFRSVRGRFRSFAIIGGTALVATVFCLSVASLTIADAPTKTKTTPTPAPVVPHPWHKCGQSVPRRTERAPFDPCAPYGHHWRWGPQPLKPVG